MVSVIYIMLVLTIAIICLYLSGVASLIYADDTASGVADKLLSILQLAVNIL